MRRNKQGSKIDFRQPIKPLKSLSKSCVGSIAFIRISKRY